MDSRHTLIASASEFKVQATTIPELTHFVDTQTVLLADLASKYTPALTLDLNQQYAQLQSLTTPQQKTVVVVGAGVVGASLALSLLKSGFKVCLVDRGMPRAFNEQELDVKVLAVNYENIEYLKSLGAWENIAAKRSCVYTDLSLFPKDQVEKELTFSASEVNLPYLGYMVENDALVSGILETCTNYGDQFMFLAGWQIAQAQLVKTSGGHFSISADDRPNTKTQHWQISFTNGVNLTSSVILAADGAKSYWRQVARIGVKVHDFPTKCMLISVKTDGQVSSAFVNHTWQRIDPNGPKAWLPISKDQGVLVWYDTIERANQLEKLPLAALTTQIQQNFPLDRIGNITVGSMGSFGLSAMRAQQYWQHGVMLFGDAAHTVSPLAGQGLNLGLQDVKCFDQLIHDTNQDCIEQIGHNYHMERSLDNMAMQEFLALLHHAYISPSPVASGVRNALFFAGDIEQLKRYALAYACGDRKLLRGINAVRNNIEGLLVDLYPDLAKNF